MFHQRSSAFAPNIAAIEGRLHALEDELQRFSRKAGRRASAGMSTAADSVGEAVAAAVSEIVDRLRSSGRMAGDEAVRLGNDAARFGARVGNDALRRVADEVEQRPLVTIAVAIGIGILIGMASTKGRA